VKDIREEGADKRIAEHVLRIHQNVRPEENQNEISIDMLRKYITYAKMKFFPRLTEESGLMLQDLYVNDR
jgi:DNA replicative helicase MCM subunit Mcm2 (Cdc46/Mcm family)